MRRWNNTIELEKPNGWSTSILAGRLAITNLSEKKQFVLLDHFPSEQPARRTRLHEIITFFMTIVLKSTLWLMSTQRFVFRDIFDVLFVKFNFDSISNLINEIELIWLLKQLDQRNLYFMQVL